jgi:hypothetical protein
VDRAAEFRRQQEMIERARALETARRSRVEKAATASAAIAVAEGPDRRIPDLRSRPGLRRAVILREILGPPIGLR